MRATVRAKAPTTKNNTRTGKIVAGRVPRVRGKVEALLTKDDTHT